ncbi:MAG: LacI family transcriptional regulator [Gaiellaceae bacterium]|nr:LacI family transcriptional regulator [Gaiellaceae bacterium]
MDRPVTIVDIAEAAHVSPSTVSRVLRRDSRISAATTQRVHDAAVELGYRPNLSAQELVSGRSMTIGVLIQHPASRYFGAILNGIEFALAELGAGYHTLVASGSWEPERELHALDLLVRRRVDALIVAGGTLPAAELGAVAAGVPLVCIGRPSPQGSGFEVVVENRDAARRAVEHLIALGHRRIAHITGDPVMTDARARLAGYLEALRAADIAPDAALVVEGAFLVDGGARGVTELLDHGVEFTGLFVANDVMAPSALLTLARRGFDVPGAVSVVGFDDDEQTPWLDPPLTTMRQPLFEIGWSAAQGALRLIDGEDAQLPVFVPELILRESTGPPPSY